MKTEFNEKLTVTVEGGRSKKKKKKKNQKPEKWWIFTNNYVKGHARVRDHNHITGKY